MAYPNIPNRSSTSAVPISDDINSIVAAVDSFINGTAPYNEIATPATPAANKWVIYFKSDGKLYKKSSAGVETEIGAGGGSVKPIELTIDGSCVVGSKQIAFKIDAARTISAVYLKAETAPTGADLIIDINKNGTTIFSTQANRPKITAGGTSSTSAAPDITTFAQHDILSIDIDQVGSTISGGNNLYIEFTLL
jgi:hypothetical protein